MANPLFRITIALGLVFSAAFGEAAVRPVWIDSDLSLGSPLREVDDGYALLFALRSPELSLAGVSSTYGNAPLRGTTARLRNSLGAFGQTLPVSPGAESPADLGRTTAASEALAGALRRERLTYLALGPLTNLATFLRLHPEEAGRIREVIMVAGQTPEATLGFGPQQRFRIHDANLVKDPAAMRAVLDARVPIVLAPIEVSSRLQLDRRDLGALAASGTAGRYLARRSRIWLWFWQTFAREKGGPIFDALAVAAAARPDLITLETRYAAVGNDNALFVRRRSFPAARKVLFCSDFSPQLKQLLLERLTGRKAKSLTALPVR